MPAANVTLRVRATGARAAAADVNATAGAVSRLRKGWAGASSSMIRAGRGMRSVGSDLTHGLTVPIIGVGAVATKMALDFKDSMLQIETQAGAPRGEIHKLTADVLDLAKSSQFAPKELADALYHAESLGYRGAKAMDLLKASVKGATVGHADLESTISSLGGVVRTGIKGTGDYHKAMATLNATVGAGNMRMDQLIEGLGTGVVAAMKVAGLSLEDYTGALAVFTDENIPASSASAQLATALHFLYAPTMKGETALNSIGLSGARLARDFNKPRGLLVALRDLKGHLGNLHSVRARQTLGAILPGGRGRILLTLLNQLDVYRMKMNQIQRTSERFGSSYKQTMENPLTRLKTAWSSVQVALVRVGAAIIPIIVPLFEKIANFVDKAANAFGRLSPHTRKWLMIGIGLVAILGPLLSMLGIMVITIGALISPVTLVVAGIAALAAAAVYAYKHWKGFRDIVKGVWDVLRGAPINAIRGAFVSVINWMIDRINWVIGLVNKVGSIKIFGHRIGVHLNPIGHVGGGGGTPGGPSATAVMGATYAAPGGTNASDVAGATSPRVHGRHEAASHAPPGYTPYGTGSAGAHAGSVTHIHVDLNGREIARAVHREGVKAKSSR